MSNKIKSYVFCFLAFIIGLLAGTSYYVLAFSPQSDTLYSFSNGDLTIHFLELGNQYAGDCIYIKANDNDILIDAGSRQNSATTIINYIDNYCLDNKLEYVIATHAHQDHIAAFSSTSSRKGIFEQYETGTIIDFGDATKYVRESASTTSVYNNYVQARNQEIENGATYIKVSDYNNDSFVSTFDLGQGITMKILYNYYYDHSASGNENNYSVCILISQGSTNILLTGDLEGLGETYLVQNNNLPECALFKAAHHGSYTGSSEELLSVIKPQNVVFTCVAGSCEYTKTDNNMFPSQTAINNISKYTKNCYITSECTSTKPDYSSYKSMNGDIVFSSNKDGFTITCNNNNILLKDTNWFKQNRTIPSYWA